MELEQQKKQYKENEVEEIQSLIKHMQQQGRNETSQELLQVVQYFEEMQKQFNIMTKELQEVRQQLSNFQQGQPRKQAEESIQEVSNLQKTMINLSEKMKHFAETINVTVLPEDELIARTIEAKRQWYDYCWKEFDENVDSEPLKRWVVNYIRHNLVRYDDGLYEMRGKTGQDVVYPEFKDAILDKIALAYPTYADECEKQKIC